MFEENKEDALIATGGKHDVCITGDSGIAAMMDIKIGDKVVLVNPFANFDCMVGETCKIELISKEIIVIKSLDGKRIVTCIAPRALDANFTKLSKLKKSSWTPWRPVLYRRELRRYYPDTWYYEYYRTNFKKVQVSTGYTTPTIYGEASCNKTDEFDLYKGLGIALVRCAINKHKHYAQYNNQQVKRYELIQKSILNS